MTASHAIARLIRFEVSNTLIFMNAHYFLAVGVLIVVALIKYTSTPPGLTAVDAERATYPSAWTDSGSLTLQDGLFVQKPYKYGPSSRLQVDLWGFARGNIDGKGGGDVAAIVVSHPFGKHAFYDLHLLSNDQGKAVHAGDVYLGDRIQLQCLRIQQDRLMLQWIPHVSQLDSNARSPSLVTKFFAVRNGLLTEIEVN